MGVLKELFDKPLMKDGLLADLLRKPEKTRYAYDEGKHPRGQPANKGQFGKGGGAPNAPAKQSAAQPAAPAIDPKEVKELQLDHEAMSRPPWGHAPEAKQGFMKRAGQWLASVWRKLEVRYGRAGALTVAITSLATFPIPFNITAIVGIAEAVRGLSGFAASRQVQQDAARYAREWVERFGAFEESKHKRGQPKNKGQFGPGGGGKTAPKAAPVVKQVASAAQAEEARKQAVNQQLVVSAKSMPPWNVVSPQQRQQNFDQWFSGSKIVDAEGKPLRVFHGTQQGFDQFSSRSVGSGSGKGLQDTKSEAYFFTPDPEYAGKYASGISLNDQYTNAGKFGQGANIVPVHLAVKNPLIAYDMQQGFTPGDIAWQIETAKKNGHDGVILRHGIPADPEEGQEEELDGYEDYIVFSPNQIKSAIGNQGTYDPSDARLHYSRTL